MPLPPPTLLDPRILVVDDERQVLASLKLRLLDVCEPVTHSNPNHALAAIAREQFDLCIVDIHMPEMDGLAFIEKAQAIDPALGFVILTGYDSEENLRRALPLRTYDLLSKPLPNRASFENRVPEWIARTRTQRRDQALARESEKIGPDLDIARIERDVELVASESAKEALLQTANLLTTIQALLLNASYGLEKAPRPDPHVSTILRSLQEARRHAEAATAIAEGFFNSAYADRENSPALVATGLKHAIDIALRLSRADEQQKGFDAELPDRGIVASDLTGIDFLLMMVPALGLVLRQTAPATTVQLRCHEILRAEHVFKDSRLRPFLWVNRKHAATSRPALVINVRSAAPAWETAEANAWLQSSPDTPSTAPSRGLLHGLQKAKGLLGVGIKPATAHFEIVVVLPT